MEESIDFREIVKKLKKHIILITACALGALILSSILTFFILTPRYEASTQILVNQSQNEENEELSSNDLQSSRELISTYNVIITSPAILEPVIEETGVEDSIGELRSKISVSAEDESQVATITVEEDTPQLASELTNTLAQTFENEISGIMEVDNVSILSEAQAENSEEPVFPQPSLNLILALFIGLIVGISLAFLIEYLDKTLKDEYDIESELKLPTLGTVPMINQNELTNSDKKKGVPQSNSRSEKQKTS